MKCFQIYQSQMGISIEQWRSVVGRFCVEGRKRPSRNRAFWRSIFASWAEARIRREAGQVQEFQMLSCVTINCQVTTIVTIWGFQLSETFICELFWLAAVRFSILIFMTIMIGFQVWRSFFLAILMPALWFFISMGLLHLVVDLLAPWRLPNFPHPSSTLSAPLISDTGKADSCNPGLAAIALLMCCGDVETNPGPGMANSSFRIFSLSWRLHIHHWVILSLAHTHCLI